ncbi:MAG: transcription antitermination factor NusB [Planctomycetia bacterium]|jgi:N utilization substance protein B
MPTRTESREVAFQVLYQDDFNPRLNPADTDRMVVERLKKETAVEFARELVAGVRRNRAEIDQLITDSAENWTLQRMAATDRTALRMGVFELIFSETPAPVAIDEAIELAKKFGSANSAKFVNGVLDEIRKKRTEDRGQRTESD